MKRLTRVLTVLMALLAFGCSKNKTVIEGIVENGEESTLFLERLDVNRTTAVDSLELKKDGSFVFKTVMEEPEFYVLKNRGGQILNLLLHPGEHVSIRTSESNFGTDYSVSGSPDSEHVRQLVMRLTRTRTQLDSLQVIAASIEDPDSPGMEKLRNEYAQILVEQKRANISFLVNNMGSLSAIYALYQKYDDQVLLLSRDSDLQYFKVVSDSLDAVFGESSLVKSLNADIKRRETEIAQQVQINSLIDMAVEVKGSPELSIPDRDGNEVALSSLNGKVVLLIFWASTKRNSIDALLNLKSIYNRYHTLGFEIYAVSLDKQKIDWMRTVDFNEFDWINVSELNFPNSTANISYNVTSIPSSFLINRDGEIVAKNLYGRTLATWLDNLL